MRGPKEPHCVNFRAKGGVPATLKSCRGDARVVSTCGSFYTEIDIMPVDMPVAICLYKVLI